MAIQFKNIKDPKLGLTDKITFGKLRDCRICDVIPDHYEYLIWAEKSGYIKFQQIVIETIQEHAGYKNAQQHYDEEVAPYVETPKLRETNEPPYLDFDLDDIPF